MMTENKIQFNLKINQMIEVHILFVLGTLKSVALIFFLC